MNITILLDESKGSGKTSIAHEIIRMTQQNVDMKFVIVSFDVIRYELSWSANDINNEIAFQKLLERIDALNKNNKNIIIDCGLVADKLYRLEKLINNKPLIKVFLDGDYNILKNRVMQRDRDKGKIFNQERFDYVYHAIRDKSFEGYKIIDTGIKTKHNIAKEIITLTNEANKN